MKQQRARAIAIDRGLADTRTLVMLSASLLMVFAAFSAIVAFWA